MLLSVEPGATTYFNSILWYHPSDAMTPHCGSSMILPNCRVLGKGLLFPQCLQARHRANLEYQWGTPIRTAESHYYCPVSKAELFAKRWVGGGSLLWHRCNNLLLYHLLAFWVRKIWPLVFRYFSHLFQCGNLNQLCVGTLHAVSND